MARLLLSYGPVQLISATKGSDYGRAVNLERISEDQSGQHSNKSVPGYRIERHDCLQSAPRRMPDPYPTEALVPSLRARGAVRRDCEGLEFEKGRYVVMSDEDFDKVRPESTRVIDLVQFADASAIDPMYVDRPYYLASDGRTANDAFAVMRDGMQGKVAIRSANDHATSAAATSPSIETRPRLRRSLERPGFRGTLEKEVCRT